MSAVLPLVQLANLRARRAAIRAIALAGLAAAAGCGSGGPAAGGAAAGPGAAAMALPVGVMTLAPTPVAQTSEYIATIKSRHSISIQPQAVGFITRIAVKSGDRVASGDVLMEIDAGSQQAVVAGLQSTRAARAADATFAHQQADRAKALLASGAGTQQAYDQALSAQQAADAQLQAVDDQIRQQRHELGYYKVTAPAAGVVGDIPVRQGDRVTQTTMLTTIDDNAGLEAYIGVPVEQASELKLGLPVRLLDDSGAVIDTEKITFIAPSVDGQTQTVLAKAALTDRSQHWRTAQFVRTQIVWKTEPQLTVPVVAVSRVNGQDFVFVAEHGAKGTTAHQQAVTLGPIVGNDYVIEGGAKAGDQLIVSGVQKIGDGMPVQPMPAPPAASGGGQ